ncbi:MAG: penicillin acylase family protein [Bacteroidia bacterium]
MLKKIIWGFIILIGLVAGGIYFWLNSLKPEYTGEISIKGLKSQTEVIYDKWGVPHIYAKNETDAYFALGYVVAQDRLFQLEMIRRLASGRLSEVLGSDMLQSDKFFRTLGLNRHAEYSAKEFRIRANDSIQAATDAYIAGINEYITNGSSPIEFTILGINPEPYKLSDVYLLTGYLAFGFAEGFRIDPMVESMYRTLGETYMADIDQNWTVLGTKIPVYSSAQMDAVKFTQGIDNILLRFPVSPWIGSNSWVLSPRKSSSGKTLLCNDTHMGYSQPAVWYEAHIEYPGFKFYGNHIAGFPFALAGHSDFCANGLTMFENDDVDFFIEEVKGNQVAYKGNLEEIKTYKELIKVKDKADVNLDVKETPHGPLIQDVFEDLPIRKTPISVWWSYLKFPARSLEAVYTLNHAKSMDEARYAASLIDAPGLNVMYGDKDGHIAWWAAAKLIQRPKNTNPKRFQDGASGTHEYLGWLDFSENPKSEDPPEGFVYSANNQPDSISIGYYPGYYVPDSRASRIVSELNSKEKFSVEDMKFLMVDTKSESDLVLARNLLQTLNSIDKNATKTEEFNRLSSWDGTYGMESQGALILNHWIYNILRATMVNKIGLGLFNKYMNTHFMKTSYPFLINRMETYWWDDWTSDQKEYRSLIIKEAWLKAIADLKSVYGKDQSKWRWSRAHTLEHVHPIGRKKPFNIFFNVGPAPVQGGNEVLNNMGFRLDSSATYPVYFGPAMRRIIDFSDTDHTLSILPTGQSGYFMADHYADQADLFNSNGFRSQLMDRKEIERQSNGILRLSPAK